MYKQKRYEIKPESQQNLCHTTLAKCQKFWINITFECKVADCSNFFGGLFQLKFHVGIISSTINQYLIFSDRNEIIYFLVYQRSSINDAATRQHHQNTGM